LEEALRLTLKRCFNPCFNGIAISTKVREIIHIVCFGVSILVLMELPYQPVREVVGAIIVNVFQSLF